MSATVAKHVYATVEQWAIVDRLAAADARPGEEPNRSRFLIGLALAEDACRRRRDGSGQGTQEQSSRQTSRDDCGSRPTAPTRRAKK